MKPITLSISDILVIVVYFLATLLIGLSVSRNNRTNKDFFLGNNSVKWYWIMLSIVATETSTLTFLGVPGISFREDLAFLQMALGFIFGRILVSVWLIPHYKKGDYTSVYQWIGLNLGKNTQKAVSGSFLITRVLGDGVRLYITSIPITIIFKKYLGDYFADTTIGIITLIAIVSFTILYTVYGGFTSVVITDSLQFFIYLAGGVFCFVYLFQAILEHSTLQNSWDILSQNNKLRVYRGFEGDVFKTTYYFINSIFGGILITLGSHGVDQMLVQRTLACKTENQSKLALIGSGVIVFVQFVLFLGIGLLLFLFYKDSGTNIDPKNVFSQYILENVPSPFVGLILAAILASAMSTLSSSINSLSLTVVVDWIAQEENTKLVESKKISFFWGMVLFFSSLVPFFLLENQRKDIIEFGLSISSYAFGPLISIFILAIHSSKKNLKISPKSLIIPLIASIVCNVIVTPLLSLSVNWIIPLGILSFFLVRLIFLSCYK